MKKNKVHKKELKPKLKDQVGETIPHGKVKKEKVKYNHMKHWLNDDDDDDLPLPLYKDEEE